MSIHKKECANLQKIGGILLLLLILLGFQELFRRNQGITWVTFLALPIFLLPWWIRHERHSFFGWLKLYTLVFTVVWFTLLKFTPLQNVAWAYVILYLMAVVNIIEAVILDLSKKKVRHLFNAAAGTILFLTLPGATSISVDEIGLYRDLVWQISVNWIIGYTIWNIIFVYLQTPQHFGMHVAVLGAPLIVGLLDNALWAQARGYSLAIFFMLFFTYKPMFANIRTANVTNEKVALVGSLISLAWALVAVI